jgi:hypothetical protein
MGAEGILEMNSLLAKLIDMRGFQEWVLSGKTHGIPTQIIHKYKDDIGLF